MDVKVFAQTIERGALDQVGSLASLAPFEHARIRIMPDCHQGKGSVIGFTCSGFDAVVPNVIGVDVGCGVLAQRIDAKPSEELLRRLDMAAHTAVPSGREVHESAKISESELDAYECSSSFSNRARLLSSLGTLGGGNHFIELDRDPVGGLWIVVHTGSRGIGKQLAEHWQSIAIDQRRGNTHESRRSLIERLKAEGRAKEIEPQLKALSQRRSPVPDDQAWLEGDAKDAYLHDMGLAQGFAARNRREIVRELLDAAGVTTTGESIESVHNYIDLAHGIIRKGAIAAYAGQRVIIPLNMAKGCAVGIGLGNDDWNNSAPHGAGRLMSRGAARRNLSLDEYRCSMEGVFSTSVSAQTIDEAPMAYKDGEEVLGLICPTVKVDFIMKPLWNFKAQE